MLREFDEDDLDAYFLLGSDPEVVRYTGSQLANRAEALENLRARPLADYQKYGYGRWACVDRATGVVMGFAGLKYLADLGEVDLGYRLLPAYWGAGLATEAAQAVLDYGFTRLGIEHVIGMVHLENAASMRVLEKIGMRYAGTMEYLGATVARYEADAPR